MSRLLLIHAFPVNKAVWEPVRIRLRDAGISVDSLDLLGFGDRACERPSEAQGLDALGDQVAAWAARTDEPRYLAGLSLGGYVVMNVLRRYPDLVDGAILVDTKASADDADGVGVRRGFADRAEREGNGWIADAMMPKLLGATTRESRPEVVAAVTAMISDSPAESIAWVQRAMADRPDSLPVLADAGKPILVIVGEEDAISTQTECEDLAAAIPGSELQIIPEAGHLSPIEDPDAVAAAIANWMSRQPSER